MTPMKGIKVEVTDDADDADDGTRYFQIIYIFILFTTLLNNNIL